MDRFAVAAARHVDLIDEMKLTGILPRIGSLQYLGDVERLQLVHLIDAEIERLQKAKLLILPSLVPSRLRKRPEAALVPEQRQFKRNASRRAAQRTPAPPDVSIAPHQPEIAVTRVAARKHFRSHSPRPRKEAIPKTPTALTSNVPLHPVAAPPKRVEAIGHESSFIASTVQAPTISAFGQAISRGLAALNK